MKEGTFMALSQQAIQRIQRKIEKDSGARRKPTTIKRVFNVEEERKREELQQRMLENIQRHTE